MTATPRPRVLVYDETAAHCLDCFAGVADVDVLPHLTETELIRRIGDYDALLAGPPRRLTSRVIERGYRLQAIGYAAARLDNVDVSAARARGIEVFNAPASSAVAIAEQTLSQLLLLANKVGDGRLAGAALFIHPGEQADTSDAAALLLHRHPRVLTTPYQTAVIDRNRADAVREISEQIADLLSAEQASSLLSLQVVPLAQVSPHEEVDDKRVARLMAAIEANPQLIDPPIATYWHGRYVILDGATRFTAWGRVERTLLTDLPRLTEQFPRLTAVAVFPQFAPETVFDVASKGGYVPAGLTRFVIPGRILRLNVKLDRLQEHSTLAAKRAWFKRYLADRLASSRLRYYQEPVVLLDD